MKKNQKRRATTVAFRELEKLSQDISKQCDLTDIMDKEINQVIDEVRREIHTEQQSHAQGKVD